MLKHEGKLVRMEPILEIIKTAIYTGRLADEKPVSVMLIAEQESAKTEALKYFRTTNTLRYISDLTSKGLHGYKKEIIEKQVRHIVLLDLVRILSHGKGISERTIQTIASLMEEGESETSDAGGRDTWGATFPRIGALMGITPQYFKSKKGRWRATGFLTRFVPVSFRYSDTTVKLIHHAIRNGDPTPIHHNLSELPKGDVYVSLKEDYASILADKAEFLGDSMKTYGFRYHRILRALAKGRASSEKRSSVNVSDVKQVIKWSEFFTDKEIII